MKFKSLMLTLALSASTAALAMDVDVEEAWVRATVEGQKATGAFMTIRASEDATLVAVSSPVAGLTEVHEMKMDGGVMRMRAVLDGLKLPAGKTVELKSGGYHVMLLDLKHALKSGSTVPLVLVFRDGRGVESRLEMNVPVHSQGGRKYKGGHVDMRH